MVCLVWIWFNRWFVQIEFGLIDGLSSFDGLIDGLSSLDGLIDGLSSLDGLIDGLYSLDMV